MLYYIDFRMIGVTLQMSCGESCNYTITDLSPNTDYVIYISTRRQGDTMDGPPGPSVYVKTACSGTYYFDYVIFACIWCFLCLFVYLLFHQLNLESNTLCQTKSHLATYLNINIFKANVSCIFLQPHKKQKKKRLTDN